MLCRSGYEVIAYMPSTYDLHRQVEALKPDIVIIDTDSPDRDTLENLCVVTRDNPRPVVMFTHDGDNDKIRAATEAGVSAYVVDGMDGTRIGPIINAAVARFEQFHALKRELEDIEEKLADRKVIERAKGVLMKTRKLTEDEAFRALRTALVATGPAEPTHLLAVTSTQPLEGKTTTAVNVALSLRGRPLRRRFMARGARPSCDVPYFLQYCRNTTRLLNIAPL